MSILSGRLEGAGALMLAYGRWSRAVARDERLRNPYQAIRDFQLELTLPEEAVNHVLKREVSTITARKPDGVQG